MIIRAYESRDREAVIALHKEHFGEQFDEPNFDKGYLGAFVVVDNDGKIVMAGGVRPVAETILVTDKNRSPHMLGDALLEALRYSLFVCSRYKIDELFAFVKDRNYERHLIKHGFTKREGTALNWELNNG